MMMTDTSGQTEFMLSQGEADYYKMWVLQTMYHISPREWEEDWNPEDRQAFLRMIEYQSERNKHASFMANSRKFSQKEHGN
jgi:starvation-inducible outer membrane lipoprotein